jgi:hypothetical protein
VHFELPAALLAHLFGPLPPEAVAPEVPEVPPDVPPEVPPEVPVPEVLLEQATTARVRLAPSVTRPMSVMGLRIDAMGDPSLRELEDLLDRTRADAAQPTSVAHRPAKWRAGSPR